MVTGYSPVVLTHLYGQNSHRYLEYSDLTTVVPSASMSAMKSATIFGIPRRLMLQFIPASSRLSKAFLRSNEEP